MFKKTYQEKTKGILQDITSWFVSNEMILSDGIPELENLTKVDFSNILQIIDWLNAENAKLFLLIGRL